MRKADYLKGRGYYTYSLPDGKETDRLQALYYDSAEELIKDHRELTKIGLIKDENTGDERWRFGTDKPDQLSTEEALIEGSGSKLCIEMIQKMTEEMLNLSEVQALMKQAETKKRKRVFKEDGSELSIDRLMTGNPEYWEKMTPGAKKTVCRLGINLSISCGNTEKEFAKLVSFVCIAADILTRAGKAVEIVGTYLGHFAMNEWKYSTPVITIKRPEDPIDLQRLFSIALPGLFRKHVFDWWSYVFDGQVAGGMGSCYPPDAWVKEALGLEELIELSWTDGDQVLNLTNLFERITEQTLIEN